MTLVARFQREGRNFLVGDLLISTPSCKYVNVDLPTIPVRNQSIAGVEFANQKSAPAWLCQKVTILSDQVVVGWAGDARVAKEVIGRLRQYFARLESSEKLGHLPITAEERAKFNLLGLAGIGDQVYSFESGNDIRYLDVDGFNDLAVIGTGTEQFLEHIKVPAESCNDSRVDKYSDLIAQVHLVLNGMLASEMKSQDTLREVFGGGFELAFCNYGKFVKAGDMLYLAFIARFKEDGIELEYFQMFRYGYDGDILVIRIIDVVLGRPKPGYDKKVFVPPVDKPLSDKDEDAIRIPGLGCEHVSVIVMVEGEDGVLRTGFNVIVVQDPERMERLFAELEEEPDEDGKRRLTVLWDNGLEERMQQMLWQGRAEGLF